MKKTVIYINCCNECPYYDDYGDYCGINERDLDVSAHLIQSWCPLPTVEEKENGS